VGERLIFSASDLNGFLECEVLTGLEEEAARGLRVRPDPDDTTVLIARKGEEHEQRYLASLRANSLDVREIPRPQAHDLASLEAAECSTLDAMESGVPIIYQATFFDGQFMGHADFLRRVERPCERWSWSYEVLDTKLALSTKPYFLVQLCNYSEHVARLQGTMPARMIVVPGSNVEAPYTLDDYLAYYRHLKAAFLARIEANFKGSADLVQAKETSGRRVLPYTGPEATPAAIRATLQGSADLVQAKETSGRRVLRYTSPEATQAWAKSALPYPHEVPHCQICRWSPICDARRNADDYLGLVAWMRRDAIRRLASAKITTIAQLASATLKARPAGMTPETFERLHSQAALQHAQRVTGKHSYELLPFQDHRGFALIPQPDPGDVFFDMEGDPLYAPERGLEYLFGVYLPLEKRYVAYWSKHPNEERQAFEAFVDFLAQRRLQYPRMHVYHYASYETTALKRLSGYYAAREEALDALLRAQIFVDLFAVVRQGLRISQPSYSIKKLEPFYGFTRETRTQRGDDSILMFESWLIGGDDNILVDIENYNRDDCLSTRQLRDWLLTLRSELTLRDGEIAWRAEPVPEPPAKVQDSDERAAAREQLLAGLAVPQSIAALRSADEPFRARWLFGHMLDYHRRDEKPAWWAYYERCENRDRLIEFDREALAGLRHSDDIAPYKLKASHDNFVHVYDYPEQAHDLKGKPYVLDAAKPRSAGEIVKIDEDALQLHIKLSGKVEASTLDALAPMPAFATAAQRTSLLRVARSYLDATLERDHPALVDVALRRPPRLRDRRPGSVVQPEVPDAPAITRLAQALDGSYLFVQGPPGSGKSTLGAAVILDLLSSGKRIAILANQHKAIHNLLHKIEAEAVLRGRIFRGIQRFSASNAGSAFESKLERSFVTSAESNDALEQPHDLAAGTAWVFSREELTGRYDYLVIDEAGQVALANAIACAPAARNLILLGDPLQLAQVSQGSHPPGVELSVLEHLLGDDATVASDRGVFLDRSYRMHPGICDFISATVYGGRLRADERTSAHRIDTPGLSGSGLRYLPVAHEGNARESSEEAERILEEIARLLKGTFQLAPGASEPLTQAQILIVAPYNAQRRLLRSRLEAAGLGEIRVGTVDKFQGQEAPVVFYSMATSSGDDLPRDVGFLFEKNRLNVAISRAQCMSVLVCSPRLLDVRCSTPEQMALVNLLCRFAEAAA
ncbi:MAG TPA: TM0106 family RecB-like putative nuclease, partial [Candidatus Tyrphobacter sp.]